MVGLGPPGEHIREIESTLRRGELGEAPACFRTDHHREVRRPHFDLLASAAVEIAAGPHRQRRLENRVDTTFGPMQGLLDSAAKSRRVGATDNPGPTGTDV